MQKKSLLLTSFITLLLINFVSAYYGSYSSFSLSNLLDSIDSSTMILGAVFIISFAFLNFALSKFFKEQKAIAGVVAFVISLLIVWGINRTGFDFEGLFYGIGFSEGILSVILPIILIIGAAIIVWKFNFAILLLIFGILLLFITVFTEIIYANGIATIIGIAAVLIGIYLISKKKRINTSYKSYPYNIPPKFRKRDLPSRPGRFRNALKRYNKYDWEKEKKQAAVAGKIIGAPVKAGVWGVKKGWKGAKLTGRGLGRVGQKAYERDQKQRKELEEQAKRETNKRELLEEKQRKLAEENAKKTAKEAKAYEKKRKLEMKELEKEREARQKAYREENRKKVDKIQKDTKEKYLK